MDKKPDYEDGQGNCFYIPKNFGAKEGIYKKPDKQNPADQETRAMMNSIGEAFVDGTIQDIDSAKKIMDSYVKSRQPKEDKEDKK